MQATETPTRTARIAACYRDVVKQTLGTVSPDSLEMTIARIIAINVVLLGMDVIGHLSLTL